MDSERNQKIIKILVVVVITLAVWLIKVKAFNNFTLITVVGEGKALTQPQVVKFTVNLSNSSDSALGALNDNNRIKNNVITILKEVGGVWEKDIDVAYPRVIPPSATLGTNSYQAVNTINVTLNDITKFDGLVEKLYSSGIYSLTNIVFTTTDSQILEKQAVDNAVQDAKARAKELARLMRKRVGRVVSVQTVEVGEAGALSGKTQSQFEGQFSGSPLQIEIARQASIVFELKPWYSF